MMDGRGKPDGKQFPQTASTLFSLAYTLKFMVRFAKDVDFHIMPMEVQWRVNREKKEFAWTMMLMQPEYITAGMVVEAKRKVQSKVEASLLEKVRFEQLAEWMCVQFMHVGSYDSMDADLDAMLAVAAVQGYSDRTRSTHDICLNDVRRQSPKISKL